jgi:hypothetical protein
VLLEQIDESAAGILDVRLEAAAREDMDEQARRGQSRNDRTQPVEVRRVRHAENDRRAGHHAAIIAEMSKEGYARVAQLAALGRRSELAHALAGIGAPASEVAATLRAHHLSSLVRSSLDEASPSVCPKLLAALDAVRPVQTASPDDLLALFDEVRQRLEQAGTPVLLLKGRYFADRLYGASLARPQFDVDLLVHAARHAAASRVLVSAGFVRVGYDLHSQTFARRDLKVDLHRYLRWAPAYRIDERLIWRTAKPVRVGAIDARTLSDDYTLVLLVLGAFEDLGQGMTKLKQLLDLYLLLRQVDGTLDWNGFLADRKKENLDGITATVFALVIALFDARNEAPRLAAALKPLGHACDAAERTLALDLTFAPRKAPESLEWFRRVYPGNLPLYLWWFWLGGFPANLRGVGASHIKETLRVAVGRPKSTHPNAARARAS